MGTFLQDLRYAGRTLLRNPAFSAVALIALALGIGANTAIFSVVNAVLFRPLPYDSPGRLVSVLTVRMKQDERIRAAPLDVADWRARNRAFTDLAAYAGSGFTITGGCPAGSGCDAEMVIGEMVSPQLFQILGARPLLGRTLLPGEDAPGRERVVVLGHGLWQRRFGSDPGIIGRSVLLNGTGYEVVGVMPPRFVFPSERYQLWTPLAMQSEQLRSWNTRSSHFLQVVGRLRPGTSVQQARADMASVAAALREQYPENDNVGTDVIPLEETMLGAVRTGLLTLLGAVGLVLLIACANVANLLLARATARRREMAVRSALGASRRRLTRQLLTESVLLALLGGAIGFVLAVWGVRALVALAPGEVPRLAEVGLDGSVLAFTLLASLATGALFGLAPAFAGAGVELAESLRAGGRGDTGGRRAAVRGSLVVAEVALSLVLMVGAGLALRSLIALGAVDPGFRPQGVMTMTTLLSQQRYPEVPRVRAFYDEVVRRVAAQPWVEAVGITTHLPMSGQNWENGIVVEGWQGSSPQDAAVAGVRGVTPDYFRAIGNPLRAGRAPTARDDAGAPAVLLVNEAMAKRYWPGVPLADVPGRRVKIADDPGEPWRTVVGVVADVRHGGLESETRPELYLPFAQYPDWAVSLAGRAMSFAVRSSADDGAVVRGVRQEVTALDRDVPLSQVQPLAELVDESVAQPRFRTFLLAAFAVLAVSLAAVGIYGVIAYAVAQRTREIGVRVALGAGRAQVLRLVVGEGLRLAGLGLAVGLVASLAATRVLRGLLYGTSPTDPATFAGVSLLVLTVAFVAAYLPARRAARVDPMVALRGE